MRTSEERDKISPVVPKPAEFTATPGDGRENEFRREGGKRMGLSIRHPKGKLSRRWYWDCQINDRSVSVGLCKMQGRPPREWSLAVPDWSVAHAGDRAFEESRARAVDDFETFLAL